MVKNFILLGAFLLGWTFGSQAQEIDSVLAGMGHTQPDESAITDLYDYLYTIEIEEPEKAYRLYEQGSDLSEKIGYDLGQARGIAYQGAMHFNQGEWDLAIEKYHQALDRLDTTKEIRFKAVMFNNIGNAYNLKGEFLEALSFLQRASLGFEAAKDTFSLITSKSNIGGILNYSHNPDAAIGVLKESLEIAKPLEDSDLLGDIYNNLGNSYQINSQWEQALTYFQKAYNEYKQGNNLEFITISLGNVANGFIKQGAYDSAEVYALLGKEIVDSHHLPAQKAFLYSQYSECLSAKEEFAKAKEAATLSLDIYEQIDNPVLESYGLHAMIQALKGLGQYRATAPFYDTYIRLRDSLNIIEKNGQLITLRTQFETEQREKEIAVLQKEKALDELALQRSRTINIAALSGLGIVGLLAFFLTRTYRQARRIADQEREIEKQKVKELEEQQKFVALNATFKGQEEERIRIAKDLHDGLGGALAAVKMRLESWNAQPEPEPFMETTTEMVDTAYGEVRRIAHNMSPYTLNQLGLVKALERLCEQVGAADKLRVNFQALRVTAELPALKEAMVYRVVQELLNNVIKHADASEVQVQLAQHEDSLDLTVEDDGKGFSLEKTHHGIGMQSIRSRVEALEGELDIDSSIGEGTSILITLPL